MRTSALVRTAAVLTAALLSAGFLMQPAHADDAPLPVVSPDSVTLYPGQSAEIDVLANDSSPTGADLKLCRFPNDMFNMDMHAVMALEMASAFGVGDPGVVTLSVAPRARGTHTIDYFVCDRTHLAPATLTVEIRDVEPVDVAKVPHRAGRLTVTNHNVKTIRFRFGHPRAWRPDGRVRVAPGETVTVRVQRHAITWFALIGKGATKGPVPMSPGIADFGTVRDIKLNGAPLPFPEGPGAWPEGSMNSATGVVLWR